MDSDLNILLVKQGVNMGDHAQDVTRAVSVLPDETVREVAERLLASRSWSGTPTFEADWYLVIRLAEEADR